MIAIYKKSWACLIGNWLFYAVFAAVLTITPLVLPKIPATVFLVPQIIVAYYIHRHFLFDEALSLGKPRSTPARPMKFGWFTVVSLLTILVPVGLSVAAALTIAPGKISEDKPVFVGLFLILLFPLYLIALSFFGTALPAAVERGATGYALSKGFRLGFGVMGRLVLGPGVNGLCGLLLVFGLDYLVPSSRTAQVILDFVATAIGLFTTTLAVAVLCDAYRKIVPLPTPTI